MATKKITELTSYTDPDRTVDVLPIVDVGNDQTKKITINHLLDLTSHPVGISDVQSLTNKSLDSSNVFNIIDTSFTLEYVDDITKTLNFNLANLQTSGLTILGFPAGMTHADNFVMEVNTQNLQNKTLSSPIINDPVINNATISADVLTGFTIPNNGSIYGIAVTNSTIGPEALSTGTIKLGYAQITSNFVLSSSQMTPTQITGLSVTVTIPTGGRTVQITVYCGALQPAAGVAVMGLWQGAVGGGTQIGQANSSATNAAVTLQAVVVPSPGSVTYNASIANTGTNNVTVGATSVVQPAFILVEAI